MAEKQIAKINWWHKSIVDWELENPDRTMNECASAFGVSPSYLSVVRNSDAFREYEAQRRADHNAQVSKTIIERVEDLAELTLDVMRDKIDAERNDIGLGVLNDVCKTALTSLGFGGRGGNSGNDQPSVGIYIGADAATLARAREKMKVINQLGEDDEMSTAPQLSSGS